MANFQVGFKGLRFTLWLMRSFRWAPSLKKARLVATGLEPAFGGSYGNEPEALTTDRSYVVRASLLSTTKNYQSTTSPSPSGLLAILSKPTHLPPRTWNCLPPLPALLPANS